MPRAPLRPCNQPSCPELVPRGYCQTHQPPPSRTRPPGTREFYDSRYWKNLRAAIRRRDPVCKDCKRKPSDTVDHIDGNWQNNAPENLQGLCWRCHNSKSARDQNRSQRVSHP